MVNYNTECYTITLCIIIRHMYLLYTSPHTLQIILTPDIFIANRILFYYSTVNFKQKLRIF